MDTLRRTRILNWVQISRMLFPGFGTCDDSLTHEASQESSQFLRPQAFQGHKMTGVHASASALVNFYLL